MNDFTVVGLGETNQYNQQNRGQIYTRKIHSHCAFDTIRMYIPATGDEGYKIFLRGSGEDYPQNILASPLHRKDYPPPPILRTSITIPVKKYSPGLQNPVASAHKKYESLQCASVELVNSVTGKGESSTTNQVRAVREERS